MTKQHFSRMKQAAHELVRLAAAGAAVNADLAEWARQIVLQNPAPAPFRPSPNQEKILALLDDAPFDGLTAEALSIKAGIPKNLMSATLSYMTNTTGVICSIKLPRMSVYFRNQAALAIGKPLVMAAEERRRVLRQVKGDRPAGPTREEHLQAKKDAKEARKVQRDIEKLEKKLAAQQMKETQRQAKRAAWSARNKPEPKPHQAMQIKAKATGVSIAPPPKMRSISESVFIPPGLQVQQLPSGRDTRYTAEPGSEGAGFMSEWKRKRGET